MSVERCVFEDGGQKVRYGSLEHQVLELFQIGFDKIIEADAEKAGPIETVRHKLEAAGFIKDGEITERGYTALLTLRRCKERVERSGL